VTKVSAGGIEGEWGGGRDFKAAPGGTTAGAALQGTRAFPRYGR